MPGVAPARALSRRASGRAPPRKKLLRLVGADLGLFGRPVAFLVAGSPARALLLALGEGAAEGRHEVLVAHRSRRGRRLGGAEGTDVEVRHPLLPLLLRPG